MQISNKLNTADFVELQKILMEHYSPGGGFVFITKYLVNFLYALVVFLGFYFILQRFTAIDSLLVPGLTGLAAFILLIYYHPRIYTGRLTRAIEKAYLKANIDLTRQITVATEGVHSVDEKGEKFFRWNDFDRMVKSAGNYFFKVRDTEEGFILKADHLPAEEVSELERYLAMTGLKLEERNHGV